MEEHEQPDDPEEQERAAAAEPITKPESEAEEALERIGE